MSTEEFARDHQRLIERIEAEARDTANWTGRDTYAARVMAAMAKVPRHEFVQASELSSAYINRPLSIGHGQTISQPYVVALMTDLLDLGPDDRVLEVGAGCGYQAAVLAEVAGQIHTLEMIPELAEQARMRLHRLGYANVEVRVGNGYQGWPDAAPFDAVMVTAAPPEIPQALVDQLQTGGRMVIPVGLPHETQMLYRCVKQIDGSLTKEKKLPVAFVPMVDQR
jgi:protein-L-isoaspartate(D-aspartate) O-methyltransferase